MKQKNIVKKTNKLLENKSILNLNQPEFVHFPLLLDNSNEVELLVEVEQEVKIGQVLAKSKISNKKIISSVNGTVKFIEEHAQTKGDYALVIKILNNYDEKYKKLNKIEKPNKTSILKRAEEVGIELPDLKNDTLVVNTFEEHKINFNLKTVILKTHFEAVLKGARLVSKVTKSKNILVLADYNNLEVIRAFNKAIKKLKYKNIKLKLVLNKKQFKQNFVEVGNVQGLIDLYEAVNFGNYVTNKIVALGGNSLKNPSYYLVKLGTPLNEVMELSGGLRHTYEEIDDFFDQAQMALNDEIVIKKDIKMANSKEEKQKLKALLIEKKKEAQEKVYKYIKENREKYALCLSNIMLLVNGKLYSAKSIDNSVLHDVDALLYLSNKEYKRRRKRR